MGCEALPGSFGCQTTLWFQLQMKLERSRNMATFRGKNKSVGNLFKKRWKKTARQSPALRSSPASLRWNVSCPSAEAAHLRSREEMCEDGIRAGANVSAEENNPPPQNKNKQKNPPKMKGNTRREAHEWREKFREWVYCAALRVYVLLSVLFTQHRWFRKCFLTKNPLHTIYSKILQKTSEVFSFFHVVFFLCVFFSWIWWPVLLFRLPLQLTCQWITTTSTDHTVKLYNFRKHDRIYSICYTFTMLFNSV